MTARISDCEVEERPVRTRPAAMPLELRFEWRATRNSLEDGWCSLCKGPAPTGIVTYKQEAAPFDPEITPHHVFCAECARGIFACMPPVTIHR